MPERLQETVVGVVGDLADAFQREAKFIAVEGVAEEFVVDGADAVVCQPANLQTAVPRWCGGGRRGQFRKARNCCGGYCGGPRSQRTRNTPVTNPTRRAHRADTGVLEAPGQFHD